MKFEFSWQIFKKYSNIKIYWNSIQWEPSCSMRKDGRADMTKLTVAFRNFVKSAKKYAIIPHGTDKIWKMGNYFTTVCGTTIHIET